jgi:hypothetical protein
MDYFYFEPEVAGELGENTVIDTRYHPPVVTKLHYKFSGWLGDAILESFPCFITTTEVINIISEIGLTGVDVAPVETSVSQGFNEAVGLRSLPPFFWLKIDGVAGGDDFGIAKDLRLVLSERALNAIRAFGINNALVESYSAA